MYYTYEGFSWTFLTRTFTHPRAGAHFAEASLSAAGWLAIQTLTSRSAAVYVVNFRTTIQRLSGFHYFPPSIDIMFRSVTSRAARQLTAPRACNGIRNASGTAIKFDWQDPLGASNLFTEEEQAISDTAEQYCQERMLPRVLGVRAPNTDHIPLH